MLRLDRHRLVLDSCRQGGGVMPAAQRVLVVDEDPEARKLVCDVAGREGSRVRSATNGEDGLRFLRQEPCEVLFTALCLPGMDGLALLRRALGERPRLAGVLLTSRASLDSCLEALRLGAIDYLTKPLASEVLRAVLARALSAAGDRTVPPSPAGQSGSARVASVPSPGLEDPLAMLSPAMQQVRGLVAKVAQTDVPVLLRGEPGVETAQVARAIHRQSRRAGSPLVRVACGAIREAELDCRLFGREWVRLDQQDPPHGGLLEEANGGTLFLDGVDLLPFWAQVKLFDAMLDGWSPRHEGFRVGPLDVRVVASTACDIEAALAENRFHSGLYYWLGAAVIAVPPLRLRVEDIRVLAESHLARLDFGRSPSEGEVGHRLSEDAWQCLLEYEWPGNIPELISVMTQLVLLGEAEPISRNSVARVLRQARQPKNSETVSVSLSGGLKQIERHVIEEVIDRCGGNKAAAARVLGLHRRTLYRILEP